MHVTERPRASSRQPMEEAARPLPRLETTPPVTKMYFGIGSPFPCAILFFPFAARRVRPALLLLIVVDARLQILLHFDGPRGLRVNELIERAHPGERGGPRCALRLRNPALELFSGNPFRLPAEVRKAGQRADDQQQDESESDPVAHKLKFKVQSSRFKDNFFNFEP